MLNSIKEQGGGQKAETKVWSPSEYCIIKGNINNKKFVVKKMKRLKKWREKWKNWKRRIRRQLEKDRLKKEIEQQKHKLKDLRGKHSKSNESGELVMSNFSLSLSVFKRCVLQTCKNKGLFGKGLKLGLCGNDKFHHFQQHCKKCKGLQNGWVRKVFLSG